MKSSTFFSGLGLALLLTLHSSADIIAGDVIAVDLSTAGGTAANYNPFNAGGTIADGSVIRHNDGNVVTGLSLTLGAGGGYNDDANANNWPGTVADPFYVLEANDIWFGPSQSLTFAGLDNTLAYNVRIYSLIGNNPNEAETFTVTDGAGTTGIMNSTRGSRFTAATLELGGTVFNGVSTDGAGNIVVSVVAETSNAFLNAVTLEAVIPEPSTLALMSGGLLLLLARRRTFRRT